MNRRDETNERQARALEGIERQLKELVSVLDRFYTLFRNADKSSRARFEEEDDER